MKVIVAANNYSVGEAYQLPEEKSRRDQGFFLIADSAVTNTGKPFFIPENKGEVEVFPAIAVKIIRLGKHIAPKFAGRYYSAFAPSLNFRLSGFEKELKSKGLPVEAALSFDRSLFVGEFSPVEELEPLMLTKNKREVARLEAEKFIIPINEVIEVVSDLNTLKMGDLIVPALGPGVKIERGDLLELRCGDKEAFQVRVK